MLRPSQLGMLLAIPGPPANFRDARCRGKNYQRTRGQTADFSVDKVGSSERRDRRWLTLVDPAIGARFALYRVLPLLIEKLPLSSGFVGYRLVIVSKQLSRCGIGFSWMLIT
jgi:hypothetical protein